METNSSNNNNPSVAAEDACNNGGGSSSNNSSSNANSGVVLKGCCHCGAVKWEFIGMPDGATACNCSVCRRYGALWAYGFEGHDVSVVGDTRVYIRGSAIEFNSCTICSCVAFYRAIKLEEDGKRKLAVNLRMAESYDVIAGIPIDHFDGLDTFDDLPRNGKCISDYWF